MKKLERRNPKDTGNSPIISLVISQDMLDRLIKEAWRQRTTKSELIRRYIDKGLRRQQ
jgi:hypothetical protein